MVGGNAPRSARSWAVRTLMLLATATAASVEPGPTGVSTPSMATSASACGVHRSMTRSASSARRSPDGGVRIRRRRLRERGYSDDAQSASPCATRHLDRDRGRRRPPRTRSSRRAVRNRKFERMTSASPDIRSMAIAWRWPFAPTTWVWNVIDSSTIGLKPGIRAVAREHLLDGDARVARPEQVDEAVGARSRRHTTGSPAPSRRPGVVGEAVEDGTRRVEPGEHRDGGRGGHQ